MESLGYAETKDSAIEGQLPDMIFVPPLDRPSPKEIWVEAKAHKLRLSDRVFLEEVCGYLRRWLTLRKDSRFKLMIFAKEIGGVSKWEQLWDKGLTRENIFTWLRESTVGTQVISGNPAKEIVSFFSETEVYQVDIPYLQAAVQERARSGIAAMEIRRRGLQSAAFMEQHSRPIPKKSKLIANLVTFEPPPNYLVMEVDQLPRHDVEQALTDVSLPYSNPSRGVIVTIDMAGATDEFKPLHPKNVERYARDDVRQSFRQGFSHLMNISLSQIVIDRNPRIGRTEQGWYYFLADEEARSHLPRVIKTLARKRLQVAKPMYSEGNLNFVFHQAFRINYTSMWGDHFVSLQLMRFYTDDGLRGIASENRSKIDKYFRNSKYNRSETQQDRVSKLAEFLFPSETLKESTWSSQFRFGKLLWANTDWTPKAVDPNQKFISDFEEENSLDN